MFFTVKPVMKLHIGKYPSTDHQYPKHAFYAIRCEGILKTYHWVPIYRLHSGLAGHAVCAHPLRVVGKQLAEHSAQINQRYASQYGSDNDCRCSSFIFQISSS